MLFRSAAVLELGPGRACRSPGRVQLSKSRARALTDALPFLPSLATSPREKPTFWRDQLPPRQIPGSRATEADVVTTSASLAPDPGMSREGSFSPTNVAFRRPRSASAAPDPGISRHGSRHRDDVGFSRPRSRDVARGKLLCADVGLRAPVRAPALAAMLRRLDVRPVGGSERRSAPAPWG